MTGTTVPSSMAPAGWQTIAEELERWAAGPIPEQLRVAKALDVVLPDSLPAPVSAIVLKDILSGALLERLKPGDQTPEILWDIEDDLGVPRTRRLRTDSRAEISAWFSARYMLKTARGLRTLKPSVGDVVTSPGWGPGEHRIISSIGATGRVYMKQRPARSAWPNNLTVVQRVGSAEYEAAARQVDARIRNATVSVSTNLDNFSALNDFALDGHVPAPEATRELQELLEAGERREEPFQRLLTRYPELLAATVVGGWRTYVIPKPRLGSEYVPDYLVLGINSVGPQWVTVEIEGARHPILTQRGRLSAQTRHAIAQVEDWREWLTTNVAYVQMEHGFHGLTVNAPGLVIIGRDDPSAERRASRAQSEERARIAVHSWDWLLRSARNLGANALHISEFAADNLNQQAGPPVVTLPGASSASTFDDSLEEMDEIDVDALGN